MGLRACYALSGTGLAYVAMGLRACYALSGTDLAYAAMGLRACYALSGALLSRGVYPVLSAIGLRRYYSMPRTGLAYADIGLRACYAMSGAGLAHGAMGLPAALAYGGSVYAHAMRCPGTSPPPIVLGRCYAMSSTDLEYAATRFRRVRTFLVVVTMLLWSMAGFQVGFATCLCASYAMPGTDLAAALHLLRPVRVCCYDTGTPAYAAAYGLDFRTTLRSAAVRGR
eukprot:3941220-Rhodomonas_salina.1